MHAKPSVDYCTLARVTVICKPVYSASMWEILGLQETTRTFTVLQPWPIFFAFHTKLKCTDRILRQLLQLTVQ